VVQKQVEQLQSLTEKAEKQGGRRGASTDQPRLVAPRRYPTCGVLPFVRTHAARIFIPPVCRSPRFTPGVGRAETLLGGESCSAGE